MYRKLFFICRVVYYLWQCTGASNFYSRKNDQASLSKAVTFTLNSDAFSFFDEKQMKWLQDAGKFEILAGSPSADMRLKKNIRL